MAHYNTCLILGLSYYTLAKVLKKKQDQDRILVRRRYRRASNRRYAIRSTILYLDYKKAPLPLDVTTDTLSST